MKTSLISLESVGWTNELVREYDVTCLEDKDIKCKCGKDCIVPEKEIDLLLLKINNYVYQQGIKIAQRMKHGYGPTGCVDDRIRMFIYVLNYMKNKKMACGFYDLKSEIISVIGIVEEKVYSYFDRREKSVMKHSVDIKIEIKN